MKLTKAQVYNFQSIRDSNEFVINDITCLVGKNEAGKTALLDALYRLNPIEQSKNTYSVTDDYPRWDVEDYRQKIEEGGSHSKVVEATYELNQADLNAVSELFGDTAIRKGTSLNLFKGYDNERTFQLNVNLKSSLRSLINNFDIDSELSKNLKKKDSPKEIKALLDESSENNEYSELKNILNSIIDNSLEHYIYNNILSERVPKFLYFDQYYQMNGLANIQNLKQRKESGQLKESDYPLLGLINLARLDLDDLLNPGRTQKLKNRLQGAGNHLTKKIVEYWSQNDHLQMQFDVRPGQPNDPDGMQSGTNIWAEVYDKKHWVSTLLGTRSRGFVWFFSFLAWYSDLKKKHESLVLLLDEPGLFLHAKAQEDLINYFETDLKDDHQLIYTTHSPFMVDAQKFERVRIVEDQSLKADEVLPVEEQGTKVLTDVLEASDDSLFPLQGALGYEIHQTLFVGPNNLIVEGVSDLLILQTMNGILESLEMETLDEQWTITPVGGSDKVSTFVSLIGAKSGLNIATLIDFQKKDEQSIENLYKKKLLKKQQVFTFADFVNQEEADLEDMFNLDFYLELVNEEYEQELDSQISSDDLNNNIPRTVLRIEKYFNENLPDNGKFNHYRPARYFAENSENLKNKLSDETTKRFEDAFASLNALL